MDIATAFTSLSSALSLVQGAATLRDEAKITSATQEVTRVLVEAQSACLDLQQKLFASTQEERAAKDQIRELLTRINQLERKASEKERYALTKLHISTYVYLLKEDAQGDEPVHYLGQPCMDNRGKKAVLQGNSTLLICPECKQHYPVAATGARPTIRGSKSAYLMGRR